MLKVLEVLSLISLVSLQGVAVAECPKGDLSGDCRVDFRDVQALAGHWLYSSDFPGDLDGLNGVEWRDFALIARAWRQKGIPLVINEFMASNSGGDLDPQGEDDDWIEIYNAGDEAVDMGGMCLTNNLDDPEKWRIPDDFSRLTTIQPGGHLIIWADTDEEDYPAGLHANFRIDAGGGELGLFDSNSAILIDKVDFPDQTVNISYGRFPNGNDTWQFFAFPTHGAANIGAYLGIVADTKFSHNRGFYDEPFSVTLATDTEDANIYYTLDGSNPWDMVGQFPKGSLYSGAIPITTTSSLRAVAFKPGYKPTNPEAHTYIFLDDVKNQPANPPGFPSGEDYGMDPDVVNNGLYGPQIKGALLSLPTVSITTDTGNFFGSSGIYTNPTADWERPTSVELIYPDGREGFNVNCGIKIFGGASRTMSEKYSFRLLFRGAYGLTKLKYAWFGDDATDAFDTIALRGGFNDGYGWSAASDQVQYIRDEFHRRLQRATGHASPHGTFVHLYLNGLYWGLYNPCERPDGSFSASYYGSDKDDWDSFSHQNFEIHDGDRTALNLLLNKCRAGLASDAAYQEIQGNNPDGTRNPAYPHLIDIPNYIDYMVVNLWSGNEDWPWNNYWLARKRTSDSTGFKFFCWDAEISMDNYRTSLTFDRTGDFRQVAEMQGHLKANAEYRMLFADHVHKHLFNNGLMTPASLIPRYQALADEVELAMITESARWGDMHHSSPLTQQQWKNQRDDVLNTFLVQRTDIALGHFKNAGLYPNVQAPVFSINGSPQHGGYVTEDDLLSMSNPNDAGTIYYTLDGSDPRLPGGAVNSAHATAYSDHIVLTHSITVKARVKSGSTWSALNEAVFALGPVVESLRISELMYHPMNWGDPEDPNREFIELTNVGSESINLNLIRFTNGIDFTFPNIEIGPGEYVLVVRNEAAFLEHYQGFAGIIAGEYEGRLDNGGERVKLEDACGQTILNFKYKDGWYKLTDGDGFTLTIRDTSDNVSYDWDSRLAAHWKLDDGSGTTATDSEGASHGTLHGDPIWTSGRVKGALDFDGSGDYISFPSVPALAEDNMTIQVWVLLSNSADQYMNPIVMQHTSVSEGYRLQVFHDVPQFSVIARPRGMTVRVESPEKISRNQWHHIAGTHDGSELKIYVDGQLMATLDSEGFTGVAHEGYIGYDHVSGAYWTGLIDDVRVYDRALAEHELLAASNPTERWNDKDSWRPSVYMLGSPGWDDSGILPNPGDIVVNEVLAHAHDFDMDWIELHNTTDRSINIGGWYLSDSGSNLMKYKIANGTRIDAHGYLVFYEHFTFGDLSNDPGRITPFALSENGDQVYLSSSQAGVLLGFRAFEDFGASERNVAFGRYCRKSTDSYNFVPMAMTPNLPNGYPKVGPVVISEIMYHPDWPAGGSYANDRYEYVELQNITPLPVRLYRDDKALPWKFTEGISFTFPDFPHEVTINPYDHVVVVRDVNAFTWRYPTMPPEKVFGPYEGKLQNDGEQVEISLPGDTDAFGKQYYIRVDRVSYSDGSHHNDAPNGLDLWPVEADGQGKSLCRIVASLYGNDPNNWTAKDPSPGE